MRLTRKMLEHEYGRYQKKVADQQKEIAQLKEDIGGYEQKQDIIFAMVAAVVEQSGTITIRRDDMNRILEDDVQVRVEYDEENKAYTLLLAGGETDGKEGAAEAG